jgi:hypothetical protein
VIFQERRKTDRLDLEATEIALRSAMHHAGATALGQLLQFPVPAAEQRNIPCSCGHQAGYQELRSEPVLTAVFEVTVSHPYYLCPHCHCGQFPADVEWDIENTEFSPGVRRMQAAVGQEAPFDHGRQQLKLLADLEVTTKAVERTAEATGGKTSPPASRSEIQRAMQLDLPIVVGESIPVLYIQIDGTGVPVVKKETVGRPGKTEGQPAHTREAKLGCVFTQTTWDQEGGRDCPRRSQQRSATLGALALGLPQVSSPDFHEWALHSIAYSRGPENIKTAAGQRETAQHRDPCASVQMDSHPISLLEGAQALRRDDLPTCARCPPPEEAARRSSCGTSVEKRCRLLENRDQRGLTEKLGCLRTNQDIGPSQKRSFCAPTVYLGNLLEKRFDLGNLICPPN